SAGPGALPASWDGTFFFGEWQRNQLFSARLNAAGELVSLERFLPDMTFLRPMDMAIGPDGRFYLIEWGATHGGDNPDAQIVRLGYHATAPPRAAAAPPAPTPEEFRIVTPLAGQLAGPGDAVSWSLALPDGVDGDAV